MLDLRNNALTTKFKERSEYIEKVRKIFGAKLEILDGETLPKQFAFEEDAVLPPSSKLMSVNDQARQVPFVISVLKVSTKISEIRNGHG